MSVQIDSLIKLLIGLIERFFSLQEKVVLKTLLFRFVYVQKSGQSERFNCKKVALKFMVYF